MVALTLIFVHIQSTTEKQNVYSLIVNYQSVRTMLWTYIMPQAGH